MKINEAVEPDIPILYLYFPYTNAILSLFTTVNFQSSTSFWKIVDKRKYCAIPFHVISEFPYSKSIPILYSCF